MLVFDQLPSYKQGIAMRVSFGFDWKIFLPLIAVFVLAQPASAQNCRIALVLAMDVSKSVDSAEYDLQMQGMAAAFRNQDVIDAIMHPAGPVAIVAFEWSGERHQSAIAEWSLLLDIDDIERFASAFSGNRRTAFGQQTAIGPAVAVARNLLVRGPDCFRKVIDVSGDGYHNEGPTPPEVFGRLNFEDITVNALVVGGKARPSLQYYYVQEVLHGPGAFAIGTESYSDYGEAIKAKLLRELLPHTHLAANGMHE